jgi:DoxX-like protein
MRLRIVTARDTREIWISSKRYRRFAAVASKGGFGRMNIRRRRSNERGSCRALFGCDYAATGVDFRGTWAQTRLTKFVIGGFMVRKIVYWGSTAIVALALLASVSYLTGSEQVVSGFAKAGYPQYLRIILGIAKPVAAIVLLLPGFSLLKEWAYAGVTFALVMAFISASPT